MVYAAGQGAAELLKSGTIFSLKMFQDGEHMFVCRQGTTIHAKKWHDFFIEGAHAAAKDSSAAEKYKSDTIFTGNKEYERI